MVDRSDLRKVIIDWRGWFERTKANCLARNIPLKMPANQALVLTGVRRAGKSFSAINFVLEEKSPVFYMNFEDPFFSIETSVTVLDQLISVYVEENGSEPAYLIFDEIQNIENWERWIRKAVDLKKYKIILTGSSAKLLSSEVASSLTGRGIERNIWPLSFKEFLAFSKRTCKSDNEYLAAMKEYMEYGAFPEVVLTKDKNQKKELLRQYLTDIVSKDILNRYQIRSKRTLDQLIIYYLTNVSSLHSYNSYKKAFGVNVETVSDYTSYLEDCFMVFEVNRYHPNMKVRARDPKKIYAVDTGLRNFNSASHSTDFGKLAENIVFVELKRRGRDISYYKDSYETDFVTTEYGNVTSLFQVSYSDLKDKALFEREMRAISEAMEYCSLNEATILTQDRHEKVKSKGKTIQLMPLYEWLLD